MGVLYWNCPIFLLLSYINPIIFEKLGVLSWNCPIFLLYSIILKIPLNQNLVMNVKSILFTVLAVVIALVAWELVVKKLVVRNTYESFDYDSYQVGENEGYKVRRVA